MKDLAIKLTTLIKLALICTSVLFIYTLGQNNAEERIGRNLKRIGEWKTHSMREKHWELYNKPLYHVVGSRIIDFLHN